MSGRPLTVAVDGVTVVLELDDETRAQIVRAVGTAKRARERQMERAVAKHLAEHPNDRANAVCRSLPFRRADVLSAVRRLRARERPVPEPGTGTSDEVAEW